MPNPSTNLSDIYFTLQTTGVGTFQTSGLHPSQHPKSLVAGSNPH
jgi:hypothetical protein